MREKPGFLILLSLFAATLNAASLAPAAPSEPPSGHISAIWANEGGDKVTRDELRASLGKENKTGTVLNRAWDGKTIKLSGARNESVSFNLVLEAAKASAAGVSVSFDTLTGPNGAVIRTSKQAAGSDVFKWVGRPIELFYVRYLQIKGVSAFGWFRGSEGQIPARFQAASHKWTDRPDHDKFYPDILVPVELTPAFTIAQASNQSIWADIYIPHSSPPGVYAGVFTVKENGAVTHSIPVSLTVQPFSLPDTPSVKAFSNLDPAEIMCRYVAGKGGYVNWQTDGGRRIQHISDVYYQFFHRHRIDLIAGETETPGAVGIHPFFIPRYTGKLYTPANGYDGPGVGVGTTIYCVGTYGTWGRHIADEQSMRKFADPIGQWFSKNMPHLQYFIYLQDEPPAEDLPKVENWAKWLANDPGPGHNMLSMATVSMVSAVEKMPDLQVPTDGTAFGECPGSSPNSCDNVAFTAKLKADLLSKPNRHIWHYGAGHPGVGTTNTEDDGIAMRTVPWAQFKVGIDRWFSWYANLNTQADWFQSACTWGCDGHPDANWGQVSGIAYTNGNGVLVYPGSDVNNKADSYGVDGPFASLRLKEWRRGTEDGDYLTLARAIDPAATAAILQKTMPKALWENQAPGWPKGDPSYFNGPVSWSSNPDDWENARAQLASIIASGCKASPSSGYCR